jgi:sugar phosphate isomerase/epimerase
MTLTRRSFLYGLGGTLAIGGSARAIALYDGSGPALPHPPGGRLGLELYSVRNELKKDLPGTLQIVRGWGFEQVEIAGFPPMKPEDIAQALKAADLRAVSMFVDWDRLRDDFSGVVRDARVLGLEYVICGWIPHEKMLTREDTDRAISSFNEWGAAATREQLRLGYHIHGYEFVASPDGTLLDTLVNRTDPAHIDYEMDVFWVVRGGGDPLALLQKHGTRIRLVHLKDISKGTETGVTTGQAPDEASVTLGTGTIDWQKVMQAAVKAGVKWYFVEDEHPEAVKQIPQSIEYLRTLDVRRAGL